MYKGPFAVELIGKLHRQADYNNDLIGVESTEGTGRHFEHPDVVSGCPLRRPNSPGRWTRDISHWLRHRLIFS